MKNFDPIVLVPCAAALGLGFRFLFSLAEKHTSDPAKLAVSLADLVLSVLVELLLLFVFLRAASLEQAFRPAAAAVLVGNCITAARLLLRFATRRKRHLSQQQKAELMDL